MSALARLRRAMRGRLARRVARGLAAIAIAPALVLIVWAALTPLPPELRAPEGYPASVRYLDRDGALLREVRADDAARARWIPLADLRGDEGEPAFALRAVLAAEDRRFDLHPGVDPIAVARALAASAAHGRVVSGASTLTMQLARLVRPHRRDLLGKLGEMALALRIEASLSKEEILEQYVNRAPFGPAIRGLEAASWYWLDKPARQLTLAEAAALAAIPRGPAVYDPRKHPERVLRRRDRILDRMRDAGWISAAEAEAARREPFALQTPKGSFGAPHFVSALEGGAWGARGKDAGITAVRTTLARDLQREVEAATIAALAPLASRRVTAASVVVLDNASGEILAYVGSPNFEDAQHGGQNDGVRARRQPGSTLKPFVYGLAMEQLGFTPATALPDIELHVVGADGATYAPMNYDERFHGPVRLREALGSSLNVPAVWTAEQIGVGPLLARLRDVGFASLTETAEWYGPALALGDGEVTLLELANAYATLARGGIWRPVIAVKELVGTNGPVATGADAPEGRRVFPRAVARMLTDILADPGARVAAFGERSPLDLPFPVAAKTGTSKGYRDNWTVGFTRERTVAVWVGNFDGSPMANVSGITGAAPLFHAVMEAAMRGLEPAPLRIGANEGADEGGDDEELVEVTVCPLSGARPTLACGHTTRDWMPKRAAERLPACPHHERVGIDTRNGLRAGPGCPASVVEERSFERFEGLYAAWSKAAQRDTAPERFSPLCPGQAATQGAHAVGLRVGYPHDGARFVIDPARPRLEQTVGIRIDAPADVTSALVRVDGRAWPARPGTFVVDWPLSPGDHVLVAEAPGRPPSPPVHVHVE